MGNLKEAVFLGIMLLCNAVKVKSQGEKATIKEFINENTGNGDYIFHFIQSDGTEREESGGFEGDGNYVVRGFYSYIDSTGLKQYVKYQADKTGYHIISGDLPITEEEPVVVSISAQLPADVAASLLG